MQHVPALGVDAVAAQLVEAGDAPDIGGDAEVALQQLAAAMTSRRMVPLPSSCTRGLPSSAWLQR
jgi:hypothetical protein